RADDLKTAGCTAALINQSQDHGGYSDELENRPQAELKVPLRRFHRVIISVRLMVKLPTNGHATMTTGRSRAANNNRIMATAAPIIIRPNEPPMAALTATTASKPSGAPAAA